MKKTRPFESLRAGKHPDERVWIREGNRSNVPLTQLGNGTDWREPHPLPSIPLHSIVSLAQLNNTGFTSSPLRLSLLSIQLKFSLSILPLLFKYMETMYECVREKS
ncbi:hypothetical protein CUMW_242940 [Citrus unshiu]|uniref:Uncharacterized protein n=1 Tax=Citrus unshiu TaxID=55188 RepID=A0A2H5QM32_CITUN|nr:hypothetical protein CUMW_242940 [Citrus unshiu]